MADFLPGDIIIVNFPFSEDPTLFSKRPAMIISKKDNNHFFIAKITRTDRTGKLKGEWIDEKSVEFKSMGLDHPSFLRLEEIIQVPRSLIKYGPIGSYPNVEKLLKLYKL